MRRCGALGIALRVDLSYISIVLRSGLSDMKSAIVRQGDQMMHLVDESEGALQRCHDC